MKCSFCGAPILKEEQVCSFCGKVYSRKKNIFKNKKYSKNNTYIKDLKKIPKDIKNKFFKNSKEILDGIKNSSIKGSKRIGEIFYKSSQNISSFIFINSKIIILSFLGISSFIIAYNLIFYYSDEQFKKQKREYIQMAESKLLENDLEGALKEYFKSLEILSHTKSYLEDRNAYKGIAEIKLKQKRYADAAKYLSKIMDNKVMFYRKYENLKNDKAELYYKRALAYYYLKKYEKARNDFTSALSRSKYEGMPENISNFYLNLYYMRSDSYLNNNLSTYAIEDINKVISKSKNIKPQYYQIRSRANYLEEKYEDAISDATTSLEFIDKDQQLKSISYIIRAESYKAKNNYKLSCLDFEKALVSRNKKFDQNFDIEDINIPKWYRESYSYYQSYKSNTQNKFKFNSKFYKNNCLNRHEYNLADPSSPLDKGKAYDLKVFYKDSFFEKNDPDKEKYLLKRIDSIFKSNSLDNKCKESFEVLNSLVKVSKNSEGYFYRGRTKYLCKADFEGALKDLNKAISMQPNNSEYFYYRGIANDLYGKYEDAITDFKKAINLDSSKHYYFYSLGITLYKIGEYEKSKTQLSKALYLNYKWNGYTGNTYNFTYTYRALLNRARAKRNLKEYLSGLDDLNIAIERCLNDLCSPHDPYIEKGNIEFLLDDTQSACSSWNRAQKGIKENWKNRFKLENIGNESVYNIYQNSCI